MVGVVSVDPSSIIINSKDKFSCDKTLTIVLYTVFSALYTGNIIETS
jgi:hypothetical protein